MLNKIKKYFFPASMIILGSFLEIFYYQWRFSMDGIDFWLAVIIGIALTMLLSLAVFLRKYKATLFLIIPLAIYSILCTSAGQTFSLAISQKSEAQEQVKAEYTQEEIADTQERVKTIDSELTSLRKQIEATTTTLEDRAVWRTALKAAEEKEKRLIDERNILREKLSLLRNSATIKESVKQKETNIYKYYQGLIGISAEFMQFALHTILSAFIALMAPLGIITITGMIEYRGKRKYKTKKIDGDFMAQIEGLVEYWIHLNWYGLRNKKSESILPVGIFHQFVKNRGEQFSQKNYETILNTAIKLEVIAQDGKIIEKNEREAIRKITGLLLTKKQ